MTKVELYDIAVHLGIRGYSTMNRGELERTLLDYIGDYTEEEIELMSIPLKDLKETAVQGYGLHNVQLYTKKTKIDLVRRIIEAE